MTSFPEMLLIAVVALCSLTAHCVSATDDAITRGKRSCRIGIHNHNCALLDLERMKSAEAYLRSGDSPGKRDSQQSDDASDVNLSSEEIGSVELSQGIDEEMQAISKLKQLLKEFKPDTENIHTVKKDCRFRLGGHCLTESLDRAANQYYYLRSPSSPGRRRRGVSASNQRQDQS